MKAVHRGVGFRTETCLPGANNEEVLVRVLEHWLPDGADIEAHLDAYGRSYWTFGSYLMRVFGQDVFAILGSEGTPEATPARYRLDVLEAFTLPMLTGLDPAKPQSAEWALFLCHHWDYAPPPDPEIVQLGRVDKPAEAYRRLSLLGVPLDYLKALDCGPHQTPLYPLDAVLEAWKAGVPIEYAQEAIYGVPG